MACLSIPRAHSHLVGRMRLTRQLMAPSGWDCKKSEAEESFPKPSLVCRWQQVLSTLSRLPLVRDMLPNLWQFSETPESRRDLTFQRPSSAWLPRNGRPREGTHRYPPVSPVLWCRLRSAPDLNAVRLSLGPRPPRDLGRSSEYLVRAE